MRLISENPGAALLVTAEKAAEMLAMGKSTFWREVGNSNLPPPVKIGSLTRWRVADLQRWVERLTPDSNGGAPQDTQIDDSTRNLLRRLDTIAWALQIMAARTPSKLTRAQMCHRLGVTSNTITNRLRRGQMPKPGPDGRWLLEEVIEWESGGSFKRP
jgi:predicted DNA-binding transcriptional regulator AlpA